MHAALDRLQLPEVFAPPALSGDAAVRSMIPCAGRRRLPPRRSRGTHVLRERGSSANGGRSERCFLNSLSSLAAPSAIGDRRRRDGRPRETRYRDRVPRRGHARGAAACQALVDDPHTRLRAASGFRRRGGHQSLATVRLPRCRDVLRARGRAARNDRRGDLRCARGGRFRNRNFSSPAGAARPEAAPGSRP